MLALALVRGKGAPRGSSHAATTDEVADDDDALCREFGAEELDFDGHSVTTLSSSSAISKNSSSTLSFSIFFFFFFFFFF